jgi:hypothetical protein
MTSHKSPPVIRNISPSPQRTIGKVVIPPFLSDQTQSAQQVRQQINQSDSRSYKDQKIESPLLRPKSPQHSVIAATSSFIKKDASPIESRNSAANVPLINSKSSISNYASKQSPIDQQQPNNSTRTTSPQHHSRASSPISSPNATAIKSVKIPALFLDHQTSTDVSSPSIQSIQQQQQQQQARASSSKSSPKATSFRSPASASTPPPAISPRPTKAAIAASLNTSVADVSASTSAPASPRIASSQSNDQKSIASSIEAKQSLNQSTPVSTIHNHHVNLSKSSDNSSQSSQSTTPRQLLAFTKQQSSSVILRQPMIAPRAIIEPLKLNARHTPNSTLKHIEYAMSIDSFTAQDCRELSFDKNVFFRIISKEPTGWWQVEQMKMNGKTQTCEQTGKIGFVPCNHLIPAILPLSK